MLLPVGIFLVIGASGDGKSSITKKLIQAEGNAHVSDEDLPEVGVDGRGVTKEVSYYPITCHGKKKLILDTMGIGDKDAGLYQLIASVRLVLETYTATLVSTDKESYKVDGIIVTNQIVGSRLGVSPQIVQEIIKTGMVKDGNGISPWERVIFCGTQRDRCWSHDIENFKNNVGPMLFRGHLRSPKDHQIVTCSAEQSDGMDELKDAMTKISNLKGGKGTMTWNPNFDMIGGLNTLAAAISSILGIASSVLEYKLKKEFEDSKKNNKNLGIYIVAGGTAMIASVAGSPFVAMGAIGMGIFSLFVTGGSS